MYRACPVPSALSCRVVMTPLDHYNWGMNHEEVRITLRLPADLHAWIVTVAKRDRRSLNSEIVHRLEVGRDNAPADDQSP